MTASNPTRQLAHAIAWTLAWLLILDIATHWAIQRYAAGHPTASLVRYFDYGRAIESKLDQATALPPAAPDAVILSAGWLDPNDWRALPRAPQAGADKLVAVYGQSFAFNATRAAQQVDGHLTLRAIGGPAAPPDHSYAAYLADDEGRGADTVVVGILASSVARMGSMTGMDWTFEHPAPFTFPRYRLQAGQLAAEPPVFQTERDFRAAFGGRTPEWSRFKQQLARNDRGFDPLTFDRTPLDHLELTLLLRRGWAAHSQDYETGVYDPAKGFNPDAEQIRVLRALLVDLKARTAARGQRLIVLLEQDQGYGDALFRALGPTLAGAGAEFISTHALFSANDPRNFQPDGHYTVQANELLARQLQQLIRNPSVPISSHA